MLIIPYLKMPENCESCPCYYDGWCSALYSIIGTTSSIPEQYASLASTERYPLCPLVWKDDKDEYVTYGGFVEIGDVQPVPEGYSCHDCKKEDDCTICSCLREDAKRMYKPCMWIGKDDFEAKEKAGHD